MKFRLRAISTRRTERFDESWHPGDALDTTVFAEEGDIARVAITVLYASKEARGTARRSGMEHGMAAGYNRLEEQLAEMLAERVK